MHLLKNVIKSRCFSLQEILVVIRAKFDKEKEEVNSELAIFAAVLMTARDGHSHSP